MLAKHSARRFRRCGKGIDSTDDGGGGAKGPLHVTRRREGGPLPSRLFISLPSFPIGPPFSPLISSLRLPFFSPPTGPLSPERVVVSCQLGVPPSPMTTSTRSPHDFPEQLALDVPPSAARSEQQAEEIGLNVVPAVTARQHDDCLDQSDDGLLDEELEPEPCDPGGHDGEAPRGARREQLVGDRVEDDEGGEPDREEQLGRPHKPAQRTLAHWLTPQRCADEVRVVREGRAAFLGAARGQGGAVGTGLAAHVDRNGHLAMIQHLLRLARVLALAPRRRAFRLADRRFALGALPRDLGRCARLDVGEERLHERLRHEADGGGRRARVHARVQRSDDAAHGAR
eukprot:CAMPEP_0119411794 /NCGR_PEP_ID=MMETSP1335-20130426/4428_1 /TAXON_ID=259385 /ORGANISM="Chrysoculter rhomboideus, Strain RCC1486" /LENGTH=341 /DNA_ID=CAMNT_0007436463 /DNA_START=912 /DNA_END=1935 /DNA_ORIENTATION=-